MKTFEKSIKISGKGIHSGMPVKLTIKPAKKEGIFFKRTDMKGTQPIIAKFDNVGDTKLRNTTVGDVKKEHVQTIEHLMAALFVMGVDSAIIEIDGPETPILDGSAKEFINIFSKVKTSGSNLKKIIVKKEIKVMAKEVFKALPFKERFKIKLFNLLNGKKADGYVKLFPNEKQSLNISATLVYPEKIIGKQSYNFEFDGSKKSVQDFIKNVARARTFGKYSEWEYLKAHGMGRGADETNVIALNDKGDGTLNDLVWADEFVRHKIIDVLGDMFTSGGFVIANLESYKGSHAMNNLVLKKLFSDKDNYDIIESK